jgi:8-oxo-dGTP pyrophosphatase MutT (NUDIX family)
MERVDVYDEYMNFVGSEDRDVVHRNGLWHKTVHCWLFDAEGYVYFQIRHDEKTLYTTASGHIMAGETVEQGFAREIREEIGYAVPYTKAIHLETFKFYLDKIKKDGSEFHDRVFANIYACEFDGDISKFKYDPNELDGLVKVKADEALDLFKKEQGQIDGFLIENKDGNNTIQSKRVDFKDFLVNNGETALGKYRNVLKGIIKILNK